MPLAVRLRRQFWCTLRRTPITGTLAVAVPRHRFSGR